MSKQFELNVHIQVRFVDRIFSLNSHAQLRFHHVNALKFNALKFNAFKFKEFNALVGTSS